MPTLFLKDLTDGVVVPYTDTELSYQAASFCILATSLSFDLVITYSLMKQRDLPADSQFMLSLTVADLLFGLFANTVFSINTYYKGWALGAIGCELTTIMLIMTLGPSILSEFAMTFHRWLLVCHQYYMPQKQINYLIFGFVWGFLAVIVAFMVILSNVMGVYAPDYFNSLQSSRLYCFIAMDSPMPANVIASLLILAFILVTVLFLGYAYYQIVSKYLRSQAEKKKEDTGTSASIAPPSPISRSGTKKKYLPADFLPMTSVNATTFNANELRLIKKALAITGTFAACWSIFAFKMVYEVASQTQIPPFFDTLWEFAGALSPILNAFILYKYDAKVHQNVRELFYADYMDAQLQRFAPRFFGASKSQRSTKSAGSPGASPKLNNGPAKIQIDMGNNQRAIMDTIKIGIDR